MVRIISVDLKNGTNPPTSQLVKEWICILRFDSPREKNL